MNTNLDKTGLFGPWANIKFELFWENERGQKAGLLSINRVNKYNALNSEVLTELTQFLKMFQQLCHTEKWTALVFSGEGDKAFIAGADIAEMSTMTTTDAHRFGQLGQGVTFLFESLSVPVIAAVNGHALGGGLEMAMSADYIYATSNATLGQPEVKLGLIPGFGGTQRLAKYIGRHRAKQMIYSGKSLKADEALNWGLVLKVFADKTQMMEYIKAELALIMENSPHAIAVAKQVMNKANDWEVYKGLNCELEQFGSIFSSKDKNEGTNAFVQKRKPQFTGE